MAQVIKLPRLENNTKTWADSLIQTLERYLNPFPEDQVGSVVVFKGEPPQGVLPADGSPIDIKRYPVLYKQIGSNMPTLLAPAGFQLGLVAR